MKSSLLVAGVLAGCTLNTLSAQDVVSADSTVVTTTQISTGRNGKKDINAVYKVKNAVEIPLSLGLAGYSLWGMSEIYGRDKVPVSEINALDKNNINSFDRSIADNFSESAKDASDKFFYGSMPLPLILMIDKKIRKDGFQIGLLYLQAMGTTGTLYTSSAMIADRFRPYTYNPAVSMDKRTRGGARNSFFAGHPALVATSTFFTASVFSHYHPEFKHKWALYTVAGGAALATGLLRIKAGEHFRTDVITGLTVGTLSGILIPKFHLRKDGNERKVLLMPQYIDGATGLAAVIKL